MKGLTGTPVRPWSHKPESGSVFVVTLAVMAGLVVLMTALTVSHRESVRALTNRTEEARARLMAEAGIQRAIAEVQQRDPTRSMLSDSWSTLGNRGSTQYLCGQDSFRLQIFDESARANINTVGQDQLKRMPMTAEQVASLLDWRDSNKTARTDGAKDDYYNGLTNPYNTKMQPFDSVPELLLVKGFSPQALYSPGGSAGGSDSASSPSYGGELADLLTADSQAEDLNILGQPKLDIRSASADQLVAIGIPASLANSILQSSGSFKKLGDVFNVQGMTIQAAHAIADNLTIGAPAAKPGLINLNTASEAVFASFPALNPDVTASIVERQADGFRSVGDLLDVPGVNLSIFSQVVDGVCVSSRSFQVHVIGTCGLSNVALQTTLVVDDKGQVRMTRIEPEPAWQAQSRWGWSYRPTAQVTIGGGS